jgi:hypothetical protein
MTEDDYKELNGNRVLRELKKIYSNIDHTDNIIDALSDLMHLMRPQIISECIRRAERIYNSENQETTKKFKIRK